MVFGIGGGDEEEADINRGRAGSPSEEVRRLASQGLSEQEIVNELKDKGYSNTQINRALNKVLKFKVSSSGGEAGDRGPPSREERGQARGGEGGDDSFIAPPPSKGSRGGGGGGGQQASPDIFEQFSQEEEQPVWEMTEAEEIELEELIEQIIDEKWMGVQGRLEEFKEEREELKNEMNEMKKKIEQLEDKHQEEKQRLEDKIDQTFSHVETIESRVGSVEKAFKEFLPSLTENVRSLSGIVKELKSQTGAGTAATSRSLTSSNMPSSSPEEYLEGPESSPSSGSASAELPTEQSSESEEKESKDKGPSALE